MPGWGGLSHNIFENKPYDFYENVEIAKEVLKYYDIDRFSLIGYSFGGSMAIKLAIEMAHRLDKLVIVSGIVDYKVIENEPFRKIILLLKQLNAGWFIKYKVMSEINRYIRVLSNYIDREILLEYRDMMSKSNPRILMESVFALFNVDLRKEISVIKSNQPPILIVNSDTEDKIFEKEADFLAKELNVENRYHITGAHDDFILRPKSETVQKVMEFLLEDDYNFLKDLHFPELGKLNLNFLSAFFRK
jgi:esterase/lipase